MTEDIKMEVIKKTQDLLGKYIKKPPLTEKLLKKPPFRFLHDIVTNVIKDTGFLDGLFTSEELNHENIKDRDGKIAFLEKLITAVRIITATPLNARAAKIVAGHEPTKTNELLQAIGKALDKKLDSKDYVQQMKKKGTKRAGGSDLKKTKEDASKTKQGKPREGSQDSREESTDRKKITGSKSTKEKEVTKSTTSKSKRDGGRKEKEAAGKEEKRKERMRDVQNEVEISPRSEDQAPVHNEQEKKRPPSAVGRRPSSSAVASKSQVEEKPVASQNSDLNSNELSMSNNTLVSERTEQTVEDTLEKITENSASQPEAALSQAPSQQVSHGMAVQPQTAAIPAQVQSPVNPVQSQAQLPTSNASPAPAPTPIPLVRPRTAARVGSARPGAPRVRNRGDAIVVTEELVAPVTVNLIVENDSNKKDHDEDEELVVVETTITEDTPTQPEILPKSGMQDSRPSSGQGHLVAQILETQKELEISKLGGDGSGDTNVQRVEIEWEAGRKRERETAAREVDRMQTLIQTLTRAAHPLGKLLDSLQEDVDSMQRELANWQNMQSTLEEQLRVEENLSTQATQPLKEQLKQLQQAVRSQLDQISSAKANILSNDDRIQRLLSTSVHG